MGSGDFLERQKSGLDSALDVVLGPQVVRTSEAIGEALHYAKRGLRAAFNKGPETRFGVPQASPADVVTPETRAAIQQAGGGNANEIEAGLAELAQIAGSAGRPGAAGPGQMVKVGESSSWTSPEVAPAVARATATAIGQSTANQIAELGASADAESEERRRAAVVQQRAADEARRWASASGRDAAAQRASFDALGKRTEALRARLDGSEISTLGTYDRTSRALLVVAAAMEGLSSALANRPSQAAQIVFGAIDRDQETQRARLQKRLASLSLSERQRGEAWGRWRELEGDRRASAVRGVSLELAARAAKTENAGARGRLAAVIGQLERSGAQGQMAAIAAGTGRSSGSSQRQLAGGGGGSGGGIPAGDLPGKISEKDNDRLMASREASSGLRVLSRDLRIASPRGSMLGKAFAENLPTVAGTAAPKSMVAMASHARVLGPVIKELTGKQSNEMEQNRYSSLIPSEASAPVVRQQLMAELVQQRRRNAIDLARQAARAGNLTLAREWLIRGQEIEKQAADTMSNLLVK